MNIQRNSRRQCTPHATSGALVMSVCAAVLSLFSVVKAQPADSLTLHVPFSKAQEFDIPRTDLKIRIDLEGFETTYDSQPEEDVILVAGNPKRHMVVKVTTDTLYTDIEKKPSEYRDLWWYFYTQDTTLDIGKVKIWDEGGRNWSTHTILTSYNVVVNERHYDMFEIKDHRTFHVSIKRPLYQTGDSTLMLNILNSFEIVAPDSSQENK